MIDNSDIALDGRPTCADSGETFRHPLLEDSPNNLSLQQRQLRWWLAMRASAICAKCPVRRRCLYDAIVRYDVAGVVAGTTPTMRANIRERLNWHVEPESFDAVLGVSSSQRVEHLAIINARRSNPNESLSQLAERLGCSLSTVKRHLRQERTGENTTVAAIPPSLEQVEQAWNDIVTERQSLTNPLAAAA